MLVTDNRRPRLDCPFCVITQNRKFELGHHIQSKKISNTQELTMQLSQTLSSAIAQIKVSNSPVTNHTKTRTARGSDYSSATCIALSEEKDIF